jgi:hypothetical protein
VRFFECAQNKADGRQIEFGRNFGRWAHLDFRILDHQSSPAASSNTSIANALNPANPAKPQFGHVKAEATSKLMISLHNQLVR